MVYTDVDELRRARRNGESMVAVHYACQSFEDAKNHPAGVAAIALFDLDSREVFGFSRTDCPPGTSDEDCELSVLSRFFDKLGRYSDARVLHWNMDRPEYGFEALVTRWAYLTTEAPRSMPPLKRYDIDGLLGTEFGEDYVHHSKLENMAKLNRLNMHHFVRGREEAQLYHDEEWMRITQSVSRKAKIIGELAERFLDGSVSTLRSAGRITFAGAKLDAVQTVIAVGESCRNVQRSLGRHPGGHQRKVITFADEMDDQYLFRALLVPFFEDIRDEDYVPSYAGGNSRVDFVLPEAGLAVELKHVHESMTDKVLGEQIMIDRERYAKNETVTHLIVLAFDYDGNLRNPRGIEKDLQREHSTDNMAVTVRILDR